jgi:hypothetical protein
MRSDLQRLKRDTETGRARAASSGTVAQESGSQVAAQPPSPASGSAPVLARSSSLDAGKVAEVPVAGRKLWKLLVPATVILVAVAIAGAFYFRSRQTTHRLTEKDTIVLADFNNETGDPVFDDTLKTALSVALNQSPFLNVPPENKVTSTLQMMSRPAGTKLTPEVSNRERPRTHRVENALLNSPPQEPFSRHDRFSTEVRKWYGRVKLRHRWATRTRRNFTFL